MDQKKPTLFGPVSNTSSVLVVQSEMLTDQQMANAQ